MSSPIKPTAAEILNVSHQHEWHAWTDERAVHRQLRRCACGAIEEWDGDGWHQVR